MARPLGNCSEELCAKIVRGTASAIFVCGLDGRLLLANPACAALFNIRANELLDYAKEQLQRTEWAGILYEQNAEVLASGKMRHFEFSGVTPNGLHAFIVSKGLLRDANGEALGVFGVARDISDFRGIEQAIIEVGDRERQRLGRELRENFCQQLVGITLLGNVLHEELSRIGGEHAEYAKQITHLVKEVVSEVRTLEKNLSVTHLEQGEGLLDALEDLAEQVRSGGEIECVFHAPKSRPMLEPQTAMYLFRIAQESVHNAVTHSQARRLQIRLAMKRDVVLLSVRDDGVGFQRSESAPFETRAQIGFPIMHYRSRAIGAKLEIKQRPRGGIEVITTVPRHKASRKRL